MNFELQFSNNQHNTNSKTNKNRLLSPSFVFYLQAFFVPLIFPFTKTHQKLRFSKIVPSVKAFYNSERRLTLTRGLQETLKVENQTLKTNHTKV